ncbi:hypothetical protein B0I33_106395 [Prauserella shujinwangii]|uniref:MYXO-CTERM domain-containing protein n=1 Tax=Prauserella shujinwangii TaxID=1453103 RepID=A0A2T0LUA6_9PSEU|nr:hypothetical protein [Prauserella shujinwangii]PRX47293.1 hypothetical protein B0I33_106395 [Prauserella shujinwangii]
MSSPSRPAPRRRTERADAEDVRGLGDLVTRLAVTTYLRRPTVHVVLLAVLGVFAAVCLAAVATRLSAWPLLPLAPLAVAGYGLLRLRSADTDRQLLGWVAVLFCGMAFSLWLISVVGRMFE